MDFSKLRLLFHHHDLAHVSHNGDIWLSAGIGRWISELSKYFLEIDLLLHESDIRNFKQDYPIKEPNVNLISLGPPGRYFDHFSKINRLKQICNKTAKNADVLLIRGMTPEQYPIWRHIPIEKKAFLLVRSPRQKRLVNFRPLTILSALINKYREFRFRKIVQGDTLLLSNSPLNVKELNRLYKVQAHFVPTNTIRLEEFASFNIKPLSSPIKLLFCGRISSLKGVTELLEAASILKKGGINFELNLVGAQESHNDINFHKYASELGVDDKTIWHGQLPYGPQLLKSYQNADIFILPSYTEGFPRTIWEAMANCCPVITTTVGGIPDLIADEKHALLIAPKNSESISEAIIRIITDEPLREKLITEAYIYAEAFSIESCAKQLVEVFSNEWK